MFATYNIIKHLTLKKSETMETNWILIGLVLVCTIGLILFLILRNQKDKEKVIESQNAEDDLDYESEREKDSE